MSKATATAHAGDLYLGSAALYFLGSRTAFVKERRELSLPYSSIADVRKKSGKLPASKGITLTLAGGRGPASVVLTGFAAPNHVRHLLETLVSRCSPLLARERLTENVALRSKFWPRARPVALRARRVRLRAGPRGGLLEGQAVRDAALPLLQGLALRPRDARGLRLRRGALGRAVRVAGAKLDLARLHHVGGALHLLRRARAGARDPLADARRLAGRPPPADRDGRRPERAARAHALALPRAAARAAAALRRAAAATRRAMPPAGHVLALSRQGDLRHRLPGHGAAAGPGGGAEPAARAARVAHHERPRRAARRPRRAASPRGAARDLLHGGRRQVRAPAAAARLRLVPRP